MSLLGKRRKGDGVRVVKSSMMSGFMSAMAGDVKSTLSSTSPELYKTLCRYIEFEGKTFKQLLEVISETLDIAKSEIRMHADAASSMDIDNRSIDLLLENIDAISTEVYRQTFQTDAMIMFNAKNTFTDMKKAVGTHDYNMLCDGIYAEPVRFLVALFTCVQKH